MSRVEHTWTMPWRVRVTNMSNGEKTTEDKKRHTKNPHPIIEGVEIVGSKCCTEEFWIITVVM